MLLLVYAVTLLSLPSDVGLATGVVKLSPARLVLVLALLAAMVERFRPDGRDRRPFPRMIAVAWAAYLAASLVTTVIHPSTAGATRLASYLFEGFAVMWLVWHVVEDRTTNWLVERAIVVASVLVAGASTVLALVGQRYDVIVHGLQEAAAAPALRLGLERQQGPFDAPLFYAVWLVCASALLLPGIETARGRRRWLWVAAWLLVLLATVTTVSRMAIIGLPLVVAAYLALRGKRRPSLAAFGVGCLLAFVAFGLPSQPPGDDVQPLPPPTLAPEPGASASGVPAPTPNRPREDNPETSTQARLDAIKASLSAFVERPLFGWGLLNAKDVARVQLGRPNYVDSSYLVFLIEVGIVGLSAFLFLIGTILVPATRWCPSATCAARLVACLSILFSAGYAAVFSVTQLTAAFWLLCGLLIALTSIEPASEHAAPSDRMLGPSQPGSSRAT